DAVSDRVRGLDVGADDYLGKPFAFEELLARVRVVARRRDQVPSTVLSFGDLRVDLATHRAARAGKRLDLTAKEHALLVFFLGTLAVVLAGFSASLYCFARHHLYQRVDERMDAALKTLEAAVEISPEGLEWEPGQRRIMLDEELAWSISEGSGQIVDQGGAL